ncbi:MAG: MFS transporter [Xanthomonadales bacterium]|nr:MFS transporter [Gammaproteobacteria bacterium]MBT8054002.1 MFS transporter [Gammaproteobacteria bacterium]NND56988.1 MFS transporter [Xanthomonadales bacterium]NNK51946.1 MFS transporter [Xanthomonadales bacterium]
MTRYQRKRSLAGVIAAMAVVNLVYGITFPLLALVLDGQGVSKTLIGLSTIVQAAAVIVIAPWTPALLSRLAPARLMQWVVLLLAGLFILAGLFPNVWIWFPLRFVIGAMTALLWICSESLINELAEERWRGRIIGFYSSVGAAGFAMGPLLLIITGSAGMMPFYATSTMILLAGIPLFVVANQKIGQAEQQFRGLWKVFSLAPTIMLANVVYAAGAESILTFFPIFGMSLGLSENATLGLLTMIGLGAMVLVMPISWLADHVDRMGLLAICVMLSIVGLALMPWLVQVPMVAGIYAFIFGGVEGMIYALGVILVGQQFRGAMLAAATTMFTACWGAGTMLGPLLVGIGMDRFGEGAMAFIILGFFALFLPLPVVSYLRARR